MSAAPMNSINSSKTDKAVVKNDVAFDAAFAREPLQRETVGLAVDFLDVRMCFAQNHIDDVRMFSQYRGQCFDDILDSLAGRKQSEAKQDHFAFDAEQVLVEARDRQRAHRGCRAG